MGRGGRRSLSSLSTSVNSSPRDSVLQGHRQDELATFFFFFKDLLFFSVMERWKPARSRHSKGNKSSGKILALSGGCTRGCRGAKPGAGEGVGPRQGGALLRYVVLGASGTLGHSWVTSKASGNLASPGQQVTPPPTHPPSHMHAPSPKLNPRSLHLSDAEDDKQAEHRRQIAMLGGAI